MADDIADIENDEKPNGTPRIDDAVSRDILDGGGGGFAEDDITGEMVKECHHAYTCESVCATPEDAVEKNLAGEQDVPANYTCSVYEQESKDNVVSEDEYGTGEVVYNDGDGDDQEQHDENAALQEENDHDNDATRITYVDANLTRRTVKCLNKMQIMENVREGCNANPPSSPGHAEQGQADPIEQKGEDAKKDDVMENGIDGKDKEDFDDIDDVADIKEEPLEKTESVIEKHEDNSNSSTSEGNKRKSDVEDMAIKRLKRDIQENFHVRDKIISDFVEMGETNTLEQMQVLSEQLLSEIKALKEMAKEKEREWNQIIHMKKIKEEVLIRIQRMRQLKMLHDSDLSDFQSDVNGQLSVLKCNQKANLLRGHNLERSKPKNILLTKSQIDLATSLDLRQKQRPTLDVQSIIADHRQRHPEVVPRRGGNYTVGQKPEQESNNELGLLVSNLNGSRENSRSSTSDCTTNQDTASYKDILVQFAKLSQKERHEFQVHLHNNTKPPPPYPEVTVHPVTSTSSVTPTNSLLHGILTKTPAKQTSANSSSSSPTNHNSKTSFSPTLARLLTAPERAANHLTSTPMSSGNLVNPSNMSLSEIFSGSKARNEITITPVGTNQYEAAAKVESIEDDSEEHPDRLIIDESSENLSSRLKDDNSSDNGDDVPQCQGCNQKPAQFVCAGCGNQWYCSRDCQVAAWDEHSEVCSG